MADSRWLGSYLVRRPTRRRLSVGRSVGVAEHLGSRPIYTELSRPNATRWLALLCAFVCAFLVLPGVAGAQTTQERIAATRENIDAAAERWFAAQSKASEIDAHIARLEHDGVESRGLKPDRDREPAEAAADDRGAPASPARLSHNSPRAARSRPRAGAARRRR